MSGGNMRNPAYFKGSRKRRKYFEGWYYKCISADRKHAIALIPGMAAAPDGLRHAFVQVINAVNGKTWYFEFPYTEFHSSKNRLEINIGQNHFDDKGLQVKTDDGILSGSLEFTDARVYPVSSLKPGIMGPFSFIPFMECYHAIVHLSHKLHGSITLDNEVLDFEGGAGYIEKDYGRSFPGNYLWLQASHFEGKDASFVFSRARIPFLGTEFPGFFAYFTDFKDHTFKFATYNRSKLESWNVDLVNKTCQGELSGRNGRMIFSAEMSGGGRLRAPVDGLMDREIIESITATVEVKLLDRKGRVLYSGKSSEAGMEISL
jgi:hypothetical protein